MIIDRAFCEFDCAFVTFQKVRRFPKFLITTLNLNKTVAFQARFGAHSFFQRVANRFDLKESRNDV
jgi:hypothetical protein